MTLRRSRTLVGSILSTLLIITLVMAGMPVGAQQPRQGGELIFPVPSEPPSYDGHREETFGLMRRRSVLIPGFPLAKVHKAPRIELIR